MRCSINERAVCNFEKRTTRRTRKSNNGRRACNARRLDIEKTAKIDRFR
jgi:hypothetical protein